MSSKRSKSGSLRTGPMNLLDLPPDCMRLILLPLTAKDLCSVFIVCSRLAEIAQDDGMWQCLCTQQLRTLPNGGTQSLPAGELQQQLGLISYRALYQVLHKLSGWPVGLWARTDSGCDPNGELLQICAQQGKLVGLALLPTGTPHENVFSVTAVPAGRNEGQVCLDVRNYAGADARLVLTEGGTRLALVSGAAPSGFLRGGGSLLHRLGAGAEAMPNGQQPAEAAGALQLPAASPSAAALTRWPGSLHSVTHRLGLGPLAWDHTRQCWTRMFHPLDSPQQVMQYRRLPLSPPQPEGGRLLPLPRTGGGEFPALAALERLEGFWRACYGPHGEEVVHLRLVAGGEPGAPHCPDGAAPRLVAFKVTGDPNVPAGKVTLYTRDGAPVLGWSDGFEHGANEGALHSRPIVSFQTNGMNFVDLAARKVLAHWQAHGQMNYIPGVWAPEWSTGQLIVYGDDAPTFSMLFNDDGEHFRHLIDYERFEVSGDAAAAP